MKLFVFLLSLCLLTSCQIYKSDFDCPHGPGLGCVSVTEVNEWISRAEFDDAEPFQKDSDDKKEKTKELSVTFYKGQKSKTRTLRVEERL